MVSRVFVNSLACVRIKVGENKCFRINSGVRRVYHYPLALQYMYRCSDEEGENGDGEEGRKWRLPGLSYADDLVFCGESEEDLRAMVRRFAEVCRGRGT